MTETILQVQNLSKSFGGLRAVDDVSFTVKRGERLGIAGPNGSGKSTLFNILSRIPFGPSEGQVHFSGIRIDTMAPHKIAALGLTRTFQKDAEFPDLSARETVTLAGVYGKRLSERSAGDVARIQLEKTGFDASRLDMPTRDLSVYERKQLMIASALVMDPKVLMLDEPASGLTRPEIAELDELLKRINGTGVTIILIEHVLSLLLAVVQRLIVLNQGKVLAEGDPQHVIRNPEVVEAYLGGRA